MRNYVVFFPGIDGLPLPTTPSTKMVRAGQLSNLKKERRGLHSPKTSLLQCQIWNVTPKGATRGGTRAPNAHDGRVQ